MKKDQKSMFSFPLPTKLQCYTPSQFPELYAKARVAFLTPSSLLQAGRPNLRQRHFHIISHQSFFQPKVYPFRPLFLISAIPGNLYLFIYCT